MTGAPPEAHRRLPCRGLRALAAGVAVPAILVAALAAARTSPLHTELKESDPAADTVLAASPGAVTLTYTTDVQLALSTVTVRAAGSGGAVAPAGDLAYLADDRHDVLVLPLGEPLGPGGYTVAWATAGPDGHRISGDFGFRVEARAADEPGEPPGAGTAGAAPATPAGDGATPSSATDRSGDDARSGDGAGAIGTGMGFLFYLGIVGVLGGVAFRRLVLGRFARDGAPREWLDPASIATWTFFFIPAGFLLGTVFVRLWDRAATFFPDDVTGNLFTVVTGTPWAAGWWLHVAGTVLVTGGLFLINRDGVRPAAWKVIGLGALLLPFVPVLSGHGWSDSPRAVSAVATYLHVVAAGGWMGALGCLLWVNARIGNDPASRADESPDTPGLAEMVAAFSRVAQFAVAVLLFTGGLKIWTHIDTASQLWTTPWGRSLLVKAGIVAGVMALGLYNWRVVRPRLERGAGGTRPAFIELLLGVAAVAVTSFLVTQPLN